MLTWLPSHFKKKNLLLLGASGGVSNAFLHYLVNHRNIINKLILLDKSDAVLTDRYIDHKALDYSFIHKEIELPEKEQEYLQILNSYQIDIALDLTDMDSIPILEATNKAGVSYINTAMNDEKRIVSDLVLDVYPRKQSLNNAVHILCTGMNPGVVNMWVRYGIEKYGIPNELIHFEYDTSSIASGWKPMMTWSLREFIVESVRDPSGVMLGRDNVKHLYPNSLMHRRDTTDILSPILRLDKYPHGFQVLHEENLSLAQKYNIPSQFIYSYNSQTMDKLIEIYKKKGNVYMENITMGDNTNETLDGADNIGVLLQYDDKRVYYFNSAPNVAALGTSGTYMQVIIGVFAAFFVIMFDKKLKKQTYFVEDLYDSHYRYYLFDNMRVQEYVFLKEHGKLKLEKYIPQIKMKRKTHLEYFYI